MLVRIMISQHQLKVTGFLFAVIAAMDIGLTLTMGEQTHDFGGKERIAIFPQGQLS